MSNENVVDALQRCAIAVDELTQRRIPARTCRTNCFADASVIIDERDFFRLFAGQEVELAIGSDCRIYYHEFHGVTLTAVEYVADPPQTNERTTITLPALELEESNSQ